MIILPDSQTLRHLPFHEGVQSRAGLGRKLREGLLNEPFLALPDRHTEQAAKPLRSGRLDTPRPQVIVCSKLKGFGFRVKEPTRWLSHPTKTDSSRARNGRKPKCLRNLVALGALAPLTIKVRFGWNTNLAGQMRDHTAGHIWTSIGKSPIELERFQQHGEAETSYPRLVTEQFEFVWIERPTLGEFVGMSRPLHGLLRCTRLKL